MHTTATAFRRNYTNTASGRFGEEKGSESITHVFILGELFSGGKKATTTF